VGEVLGNIAAQQSDADRKAAARAWSFSMIADKGGGHAAGWNAKGFDGQCSNEEKERDEADRDAK
jgi:hypothetical protein